MGNSEIGAVAVATFLFNKPKFPEGKHLSDLSQTDLLEADLKKHLFIAFTVKVKTVVLSLKCINNVCCLVKR